MSTSIFIFFFFTPTNRKFKFLNIRFVEFFVMQCEQEEHCHIFKIRLSCKGVARGGGGRWARPNSYYVSRPKVHLFRPSLGFLTEAHPRLENRRGR
jgi:hypothetical protein